MLTLSEALGAILERIPPAAEVESVPLAEAAGRCLAARVVSDVDLPPFEKSAMDGYAVRSSDFESSTFEGRGQGAGDVGRELACIGESRAGSPFEGVVAPYSCVAIYTGAKLPAECDAVEMVEHTRCEGSRVSFQRRPRPGQNVSHRAEVLAAGAEVFGPHRRLDAVDLAVLATVGCDPVPVFRRPRVSILTTGDELVEVDRKPGPGQIREGNTLLLRAACEGFCEVVRSGIVRDDAKAIELAFRQALSTSDVLITSGGVSVGKYDLVGAALQGIGVEPVLHKVAIKPGKPIWFGMAETKPVFGLPGNPVSSLLGFLVFVRPALARMAGAGPEEERERLLRGRWVGASTRSKGRQFNLPVWVRRGEDGVDELEPLPWKGSADLVALTRADAFAVIPPDEEVRPGAMIDYRPLG